VAAVGTALELAAVDETVVDAPVVDETLMVALGVLVEVPEVDVAAVDEEDSFTVGSGCDPTPTAVAPASTAVAARPAEASVTMAAVAIA
jgi:hypothetical protein